MLVPIALAGGFSCSSILSLHYPPGPVLSQNAALFCALSVLAVGQWWAAELRRRYWAHRVPSSQAVRRRSR